MACSIRMEMTMKTVETSATAHVGVSFNDLSIEPPPTAIACYECMYNVCIYSDIDKKSRTLTS